ncbi:MAG: RimK domain-containing protein, partial [Actinomycetes bacterium]
CVSVTATTLQRFVPKAFEVRLTVIGGQWFPIAIHALTESAHTDWRSDPSALAYEFVPVPDSVADGVSQYLELMNLAYAGLDFVVTPNDGEWVMLEANSGPQFGWLEAATGAPMAAAMADLLLKGAA